MKLAVVTDDGTTVSQHFGRARYYAVLTVKDQHILGQEMLDRGDMVLPPDEHHEARHGLGDAMDCHGTGTGAAAQHHRMVEPIKGCEALLTRGLSWSARECIINAGIRPVLTDIAGLNEAVAAYLDGTIVDHVDLLH